MFRIIAIAFFLLAVAPAQAENPLINLDPSLFDPGALNNLLGGTPGTTAANPEFANLNGFPSSTGGGFGPPPVGGIPGFDPLSAQAVAGDPLLRGTLDNFLRCVSQYGAIGTGTTSTASDDDLFGFGGQPASTGINISDTSNPTVRFCIETAKSQTKEMLIHQAQATLAAIEDQKARQQRQDLSFVMAFLQQNGGVDDGIAQILPLLLGSGGDGGGGFDPTSLLLGGF